MFLLPATDNVWAQSNDGAGAEKQLNQVQQEVERKRREAERLTGQAKSLETDLKNLRQQLVSAAKIVRDRELRVITLEARIADLVRQEREKAARLNANRTQLAGVLVALQRMVQFPPEALLALPESPDDLVRSAILLRSVVPEIERRAASIKFDLEALADARRKIADERLNLTSASRDLASQRGEIKRLMANKQRMLARTRQERDRAARNASQLAAKARNLRDLMARLEDAQRQRAAVAAKQRREEEARERAEAKGEKAKKQAATKERRTIATVSPSGSIKSNRGRLPLPVVGELVGKYGESLPSGLHRKGVDIATRGASEVIAPFEGIVAFAGKFRGYGQLLIIDHGDGYHTLLAGMADIDASVGQPVSTGEPVGRMGPGGAAGERPVLYVELRRKGQPVNPMPWLASASLKASG